MAGKPIAHRTAKKKAKRARNPHGKPKIPSGLRPISAGTVFADAKGNTYFAPNVIPQFKPLPTQTSGGRPSEVLRDISLAMHFHFLTHLKRFKATEAYIELGKLFSMSTRNAIRGVKRATKNHLRGFLVLQTGGEANDDPVQPGSGALMMELQSRDAITVDTQTDGSRKIVRIDGMGFVTAWGQRKANWGRIQAPLPSSTDDDE